MVAMTNFTDMIKTAISEKVDLITAGAGLPLDLPSFLKKDSTTKLDTDCLISKGNKNNL